MKNRKPSALLLVLVMLSLIAAGCSSPQPTPVPPPPPTPTTAAVAPPPATAVPPTPMEAASAPTAAPTDTAAPKPTEVPTQPAAQGPSGTLVIGLPGEVNALDKANGATEFMNSISRHITQFPFEINPDGTITPSLAASYEVLDPTHIRLHLRQGVSFTNGEPFNAGVVTFSNDWSKSQKHANVEDWRGTKEIKVIDDYTVEITLTAPDPSILSLMAYEYPLYPPVYTQKVGMDGYGRAPIGTGPFMLQEWAAGGRIVLKANPHYWQPGLPKLDTVIVEAIPEAATRAAALQAGDVDIARLLPVEQIPQLKTNPNLTVLQPLGTRLYSILFNNITTGKDTPIKDPIVRQALNYAVDKETIVKTILGGYGVVVNSLIGPEMLGYDPSLPPFPYDPTKAKQLLAQAGYPNGFKIAMACPSGAYVKVEEVCQAVAGYLKDVGVTADLKIEESGKFWDEEANKTIAPLFFDGWGNRLLDPTWVILSAFVPTSEKAYGSDYANFFDPKYVQIYESQDVTSNLTVQKQVLGELGRYMQESPGAIYLYQMNNFEGISNRVHGLIVLGNETMLLSNVWVDKK